MLEVEGERAIIYGLGKRRWAVPTRFPQFEGAPNPDAQTPAGKLLNQFCSFMFFQESFDVDLIK